MSLMPRSRLIDDSIKSPVVAATAAAAPATSPVHHGPCSASTTHATPTAMQNSTEPAKPSHDFLGLMVGAIGWRPARTPTAYPPMSLATVTAM
jgi:hypothetical protein